MKPWLGTLLWIVAGIAPLAIALLVLVRWDEVQRDRAARAEAQRDAQALARVVALTVGMAQRQLERLSDAPALEQAVADEDPLAVADELARFRQTPAWRGLVVVDQRGETVATAGNVLSGDLEAAPTEGGIAVVRRVGHQPARAVLAAPIVVGGVERAWLLGTYSLAEIEAEIAAPSAGGLSMLLEPDGPVLIGPGRIGADTRIDFDREGARIVARVAGKELEAAIVPVLAGNAQVASIQEPAAFARGVGGAVAALLVAMGVLAAMIATWRIRLARAEERVRFRELDLAALQELATDATVSPSREQILRMAGARAAQLLPGIDATYVAIAHGEQVHLHHTYPEPRETVALPAAGNLLVARVLQHGRRESGRSAAGLDPAWRAAGFEQGRWESWTPIVAHGRILGALGCRASRSRDPLPGHETRLLDSLAATLAVALESHERLAELARQRAVLATILDSSPDAILALDEANTILLENKAARTIFRLRRPGTGRQLRDMIDEAGREGGTFEFDYDPERLLRASREGSTTRGSFRLRFDGETHVMESLMAPLHLPEGGAGSLVAMRDVTARTELEEVRRLHRQVSQLATEAEGRAALLERILAASDMGLVFLDREGRVGWANQRFGQLLRIPVPEQGMAEAELADAIRRRTDEEKIDLRLPALIHTRGPVRRILALGSTEVRDPAGRKVGQLVSLRDETARRELEQARESFIGVAAHELKNPLAVLRLQAEMGLRDGKRAPDSLRRILERTRQLQALVDSLLDVTRADLDKLEVERTEVDPMACVREAAEPFLAAHAPIRVYGAAPHLVGDPMRIKQVIGNLLSNAVRYGGEGPIDVLVSAEGGVVRIAVRDRGPGIPPEEQRRIFERFAQGGSGSRKVGLGIGLYLSRRIAEAHGGRIELESAPGKGSTFTLVLPGGGQEQLPAGYSSTQAATQP